MVILGLPVAQLTYNWQKLHTTNKNLLNVLWKAKQYRHWWDDKDDRKKPEQTIKYRAIHYGIEPPDFVLIAVTYNQLNPLHSYTSTY